MLSTYNEEHSTGHTGTNCNNYVLARWSGVKTYQRPYGDDGTTCPRQQSGEEGMHAEEDQGWSQRASMQKSRRHTRPTRWNRTPEEPRTNTTTRAFS